MFPSPSLEIAGFMLQFETNIPIRTVISLYIVPSCLHVVLQLASNIAAPLYSNVLKASGFQEEIA